jgi:hypothetical protein
MDEVGAAILIGILFLFAVPACWWLWQIQRVHGAKKWPTTEGTIQSAEIEVASTYLRGVLSLPVCAFTYQINGESYSGRFSLVPNAESGETLIKKIVDRKIRVQYAPRQPSAYFLPYEVMDGCDVKQKMDPHLFRIYPTE